MTVALICQLLQVTIMNKILIIGASGHAKVIIDIIERQKEYEIFGLIDSFKQKGNNIFNYKILGTEHDIPTLLKNHDLYGGIIAIGDNWIRQQLQKKITALTKDFNFINAIHPNATIGKNVKISLGTVVMAGAIINSDAIIGKHCVINTNCSVGHDAILKSFVSISPGVTIGGDVKIGSCSAISLGANVLEQVVIGKHTVIGAGAVVIKNIGDYLTAYGVPAKPIKERKPDDKYLGTPKKTNSNIYKLSCYTIDNESAIEKYVKTVKHFDNYDATYSLQFCNSTKEKQLSYFVYKKSHEPVIVLPVYLNKIINPQLSINDSYYDASSPYGYSGPLFNDRISSKTITAFWNAVDLWYSKNNVVTEFIRFNLSNNHMYYSGHVIPTLNNVKGKIHDFDSIWSSFKQKVRNNYRKAEKSGLKINIIHKTITIEDIAVFYNIYIKTMVRKDAATNYYYPKDYFENLIFNNQTETLLAIVYKDDIAISTELILLNNNQLYSYLGGTISEYFNYRPNEFLKIELIKWAINNNVAYYVLGGGRTNDDSLYQYKKTFFPKDEDAIYYTGKKVINKDIYNKLIKASGIKSCDIDTLIENTNEYFPVYRKIQPPNYTLEIITNKVDWDKTLAETTNFDFYHTYHYHSISITDNEKIVLLKYTEGEVLICLPLIIRKIQNTKYYDATSVYGYSGTLNTIKNASFDNSNYKTSLVSYFKEQNIISVFSRLNPFIENQDVTLKNIGQVIDLGNIVNIDLTKKIEEQYSLFSKSTKRHLNKTKTLFNVKISDKSQEDIDTFIQIYYENMDRVHAQKQYYFSRDYFTQLINNSSFDCDLVFAVCKKTNETASCLLSIKINKFIVQYHLSGTKNDYLHLSPMRLLIDTIRIKATQDKYKYLNLGGGLNNREDELFRFKSSFSKDFRIFKVWNFIVDEAIYNKLLKDFNIDIQNNESDFFPLYRLNDQKN